MIIQRAVGQLKVARAELPKFGPGILRTSRCEGMGAMGGEWVLTWRTVSLILPPLRQDLLTTREYQDIQMRSFILLLKLEDFWVVMLFDSVDSDDDDKEGDVQDVQFHFGDT